MRLFEDGVTKPKAVLSALNTRGIEEPTTNQLNNFLLQLRRKRCGKSTINVSGLKKWCLDQSLVPTALDLDQPCVLAYNVDVEPPSEARSIP